MDANTALNADAAGSAAACEAAARGGAVISRRLIPLESGDLRTTMTIERRALCRDSRVMLVHLAQNAPAGSFALTVEFLEALGREPTVRGSFSVDGSATRYFESLPAIGDLAPPSSQKARAWCLIDGFIESGAPAALSELGPELRSSAAPTLLGVSPDAVPAYRSAKLSKYLNDGTVVMLFEHTGGRSINISHTSQSWGDQLIFFVPGDQDDEIASKMMENFFDELACLEAPRQLGALADLTQYVSMERGRFEMRAGARHSLAQVLYRKLQPAFAPRLDHWRKGPFQRSTALSAEMLLYGTEYETLRRKDARFDIFSEMELALAPAAESPHSRALVRNDFGLELRFNLPPVDSLRAWLKQIESFLRCFISHPEKLTTRFGAWLDPAHGASFPADAQSIEPFNYLCRIFRAADKAKPAGGQTALQSELEYKEGVYLLHFSKGGGAKGPTGTRLTFKVAAGGIESVTVGRHHWAMPLRRVFLFKPAAPNFGRLQKLFSLFYQEEDAADGRAPIEETCLCRYLSGCYCDRTPRLQNTAIRVTSFVRRVSAQVEQLFSGL